MSTILKAENISKQYRLGVVGTGTLGHDLNRWWHSLRGKEDPYLKVGAVNNRSEKANEEYVWALQNINFEVKQGEVLGIIGKNGAGKSTLLKILSRVTSPTTGSIKTKGRIASLLEVGTGFHGELTGRENIFMNGAVLGMTRAEINRKLEEIIDFSGCEKYIDTPVKRYSSGMKVRLGFAVAAHLETEILVVDEVLAVGDAEFQKKAIGKMQDLSTEGGRTVLFVSHNMVSIQQLCTRCLMLENGSTTFVGNVNEAINKYLSDNNTKRRQIVFPVEIKNATIFNFNIVQSNGEEVSNLIIGNQYSFNLFLRNCSDLPIEFNARLQLFNENNLLITTLNTYHVNKTHTVKSHISFKLSCIVDKLAIATGDYHIGLEISDLFLREVLYQNDFFSSISIHEGDYFKSGKIPTKDNIGLIFTDYKWKAG